MFPGDVQPIVAVSNWQIYFKKRTDLYLPIVLATTWYGMVMTVLIG